jgi:hypothetical protein
MGTNPNVSVESVDSLSVSLSVVLLLVLLSVPASVVLDMLVVVPPSMPVIFGLPHASSVSVSSAKKPRFAMFSPPARSGC